MNIRDVVAQITLNLPKFTDVFSDFLPSEITGGSIVAGRKIRLETESDSGLEVGDTILVNGIKLRNKIEKAETKHTPSPDYELLNENELYIELLSQHDFTSDREGVFVELSGFEEAEYNGLFEVKEVPCRKSLVVKLKEEQSPPHYPELTDTEHIWEARDFGGNGVVEVSGVSANWFEYYINELDPNLPEPSANSVKGGKVLRGVRVTGCPDPKRAMEIYTNSQNESDIENKSRKAWLFVMFPDEEVSRDENTRSDAQATFVTGEESRQRILVNFDVLAVLPTNSLGAFSEALFACGELRNALIKSLVGIKSPEQESDVVFKTVYLGSTMSQYDTATYLRMYSFQTPFDITFRQTSENYPLTVALREAIMKMLPKSGTEDTKKIIANAKFGEQ